MLKRIAKDLGILDTSTFPKLAFRIYYGQEYAWCHDAMIDVKDGGKGEEKKRGRREGEGKRESFFVCLLVGCSTSQHHDSASQDGSAQTVVRAATLR